MINNQQRPRDVAPQRLLRPASATRIGFVSTYPPTLCGLATFTASLRTAMIEKRGDELGLDVVELVEGSCSADYRPEVVSSVDPADRWSLRTAGDRLSGYDAVILQHEYGIWGPDMGLPVIDFVERLDTGLITTLHTLLPDPTRIQRRIIETLTERSAFTVVPTQASKDLISARYQVDPRSIVVIPHGTSPFLRSVARLRALAPQAKSPPRLLTWGLIGPGKGLEWSLKAVALLKDRYPNVRYTIAGRTHPKVLLHDGEAYRRSLEAIVSELDLTDNVELVDDYVSESMLRELLLDTTTIVLPYDSTEQIVSGVLVEAVAAHVPVVATAFPHAVELASQGAVSAVPHRNPEAIAHSVVRLVEDATVWDETLTAQWKMSPELEWANVAIGYEQLIESSIRRSVSMSHASPAS